MQTYLWALGSLVVLVPILYFLPLGMSKKGKWIALVTSVLLASFGLLAQMVVPLWELLVLLVLLIGLVVYMMDKKLGAALYIPALAAQSGEVVEMSETEYQQKDVFKKSIQESSSNMDENLLNESVPFPSIIDETTTEEIVPESFVENQSIDEVESFIEGVETPVYSLQTEAPMIEEDSLPSIQESYLADIEELLAEDFDEIEQLEEKENANWNSELISLLEEDALDSEKEREVQNPILELLEDDLPFEKPVAEEDFDYNEEITRAYGETAGAYGDDCEEEPEQVESSEECEGFSETQDEQVVEAEPLENRKRVDRELLQVMVSQLELLKKHSDSAEYESQLQAHMNEKLALHDYYTFASMLVKHYISTKNLEKLEILLQDLSEKVVGYTVLESEIDYLYDRYCSN